MRATDVTGFDAIFSTRIFRYFLQILGARLTKLHINTGEKAKNPVESLQWRRRPEIADLSLVVVERALKYSNVKISGHESLFWEQESNLSLLLTRFCILGLHTTSARCLALPGCEDHQGFDAFTPRVLIHPPPPQKTITKIIRPE